MPPWQAIRFFNEQATTTKTRNRLPHWQQEGACYFITFRLADSLPHTLLTGFREEHSIWMDLHPKPWPLETELDYRRTFLTHHRPLARSRTRQLQTGSAICL